MGRCASIPRPMEPVPFEKMHGCGNDFVVLDGRRAPIPLTPEAVRRIGDRHRGVGFLGLGANWPGIAMMAAGALMLLLPAFL